MYLLKCITGFYNVCISEIGPVTVFGGDDLTKIITDS